MAATSSAVVLIILQAVPQTQALLLLCSLGCMGRSVQGFAHHDGLLRQQGVAHLFSDPGCKAASVQLAGGRLSMAQSGSCSINPITFW